MRIEKVKKVEEKKKCGNAVVFRGNRQLDGRFKFPLRQTLMELKLQQPWSDEIAAAIFLRHLNCSIHQCLSASPPLNSPLTSSKKLNKISLSIRLFLYILHIHHTNQVNNKKNEWEKKEHKNPHRSSSTAVTWNRILNGT